MRTLRSSSKRFKDFEFNDDDERVERISKKILGKFGNPKSDHSPVTKYKFLQCFAHGTKTKQMDFINEILDVDADDDADDDAVKGEISRLDTVAPATRPKYVDSGCFFSGVNSYPARALNHGVTSTGSKYLDSNLPQFLSDNEPVSINSDDDERMELSSSTSASDFAENEGPLEEQVEHRFDGCVVDTSVVVYPDYVIYGDMYCTKSCLTFSCCCIRVEGSAVCGIEGPFSFEWTVDDIIDIESQWCGLVETAVVNLCLKSKETKVAENGIAELKFAVFDPDWFERQEAIQSLDVRYKAKWNIVSDIDTARREDTCLGSNNIFISKHYFSSACESFEDVIYPRGDPDAVSISKRDIELLQPETFINDTIIDFYIKSDMIQVEGSKWTRGMPRETWIEPVRKDINILDLTKDMALDEAN